jgi:hypothetical protein
MRSTGPLARPNLVAAWGVDELLVRCRFGLRHAPAPGREPWLVDEDGCAATLRLAAVASHEREDCAFAPVRCMHADPETVRPRSPLQHAHAAKALPPTRAKPGLLRTAR